VEEAQEDKRFHFILPGGSRAAAYAHVCRTVCRRAERAMLRVENLNVNVNLNENQNENDNDMTRYVNRLSDYLFILARKLNVDNGVKDVVL
jgi:cob(I)alamin adenosyltransferase